MVSKYYNKTNIKVKKSKKKAKFCKFLKLSVKSKKKSNIGTLVTKNNFESH